MSFSSGKLSLAAATVALAACAALPSAASAETQAVTGTVISASLAIGAITPATFAGLGTAAGYDTTGGTVALIVIGPWVARVSDVGTSVGRLTATTPGAGSCVNSTTTLANALGVSSTGSLLGFTAAAPVTLSATAQPIASGTGSNVMTLVYHHTTSASDQLMPLCAYGLTSTVALAAV